MASYGRGGRMLYSLVADSTSIIAETTGDASAADTAKRIIEQVDFTIPTKKTYESRGQTFNYVVDDGVVYLVVATGDFQRRICFSYLERLKSEFKNKGKSNFSAKDFRRFMEKEMEFFTSNPEADKIRGVMSQVEEVKGIMMENIDRVLERGEKLEDIDRKANDLVDRSKTFHKRSKELKCALCVKNAKLTIALIVAILILLFIVAIIIWQTVDN